MDNIKGSIVLVGGGGGVYQVARFLKYIMPPEKITTVSSMFDHGGHSGMLRDERHILPPGDIMQAVLALSGDDVETEWKELLSHRFSQKGNSSLDNATMRNFLFTYFVEKNDGNIISAINSLRKVFKIKGKILPVSLDDSELCVNLSDGSVLKGEGKIDGRSILDGRTIISAFLSPGAGIYGETKDAIINADKIVFCPGDFFTSIIPNTLVEGFKDALAGSKAKVVLIMNLVTKKAETPNFTASKFAQTLLSHIGRKKFDVVICNKGGISRKVSDSYKKSFSYPVKIDKALHKFTSKIISDNLGSEVGGVLRHKEMIASIVANI